VKYVAIIEKTDTGWSAYAPDLPLVVAAGETHDEARQLLEEGIEIWIEETRAEGLPIPEPTTQAVPIECA
jgi:predicted RNase H-like HicB family nuclease